MSVAFFLQKFESKSNEELKEIAEKHGEYVLEARVAALDIIKSRDAKEQITDDVGVKLRDLEKAVRGEFENEQQTLRNTRRELEGIEIKRTRKYRLENGNELQVQRLTETLFQIRIESSKSLVAPTVICSIKDKENNQYFPFFYLNGILIFAALSIFVIGVDYFIDGLMPESYVEIAMFFAPFAIGFQILMMPFFYPLTVNTFKREFGRKNAR